MGLEHQGDPFLDELLHAAVFGRGDDPELPRDRRLDVGADVLLALAGGCRRAAARLCGRLDRSGEPVAHRDLPSMVRKQNVCTR